MQDAGTTETPQLATPADTPTVTPAAADTPPPTILQRIKTALAAILSMLNPFNWPWFRSAKVDAVTINIFAKVQSLNPMPVLRKKIAVATTGWEITGQLYVAVRTALRSIQDLSLLAAGLHPVQHDGEQRATLATTPTPRFNLRKISFGLLLLAGLGTMFAFLTRSRKATPSANQTTFVPTITGSALDPAVAHLPNALLFAANMAQKAAVVVIHKSVSIRFHPDRPSI